MTGSIPQCETTIGHHGTYWHIALVILAGGFKIFPNSKHYWGDGVYFYESGIQDAIWWIKRCQRLSGDFRAAAVIEAMIEVGECLDLDNPSHRQLLLDMRNRLIETGVPAETVTEAVAINALADILESDSVRVRNPTKPGPKLFRGARLAQGVQQRILCVRNLHKILITEVCYQE